MTDVNQAQISGLQTPSTFADSKILGSLAVLLGASLVTYAGRVISLALADTRGAQGWDLDASSWLPTCFNAMIVFMGPLTVYIGALLGARRVLLFSAAMLAVVTLLVPLAHSTAASLLLLGLAGVFAGTFYPMTLTFALRNLPIKWLSLTIAFYATCIEAAVNFSPAIYGALHNHGGWRWGYWSLTFLSITMAAAVFLGVAPQAAPKTGAPQRPSFSGLLYASLGFGLLYAALDQGQRLDWFHSNTFIALLSSAAYFLFCSAIKRLRQPNPLIDLPYLRQWNTQLLAALLVIFRFCLLATILAIPQSLSVRGLDNSQIAPALSTTAAFELVFGFLAGWLILRRVNVRIITGLGFGCIALACALNGNFDSSWNAEIYQRTAALMGLGQSFAFVGLVASLLSQAIYSGGIAQPQRVLTFSAFLHTVRLVGGQAGSVLMGRVLAEREKLHSNQLGLHVQSGADLTRAALVSSGRLLSTHGLPHAAAGNLLASRVRLQAYALTTIDVFHLITWASVAALVLLALLKAPAGVWPIGISTDSKTQEVAS